ncbi:MAG: endolytic transglycosylase MltG [Proteobacteria bacterium]|nr:endolytic transglycosylase MltG [Cystobacterineae bacterium]MCL2314700.1 endolytic transglycosylase MltG [Pseudomonadota bacterium]
MKRILVYVLLSLSLLAIAALGYWLFKQRKLTEFSQTPFGNEQPKSVLIQRGTGPRALARLLYEAEVIQEASLFYEWVRREGVASQLKAGEYEFVGPLTPAQITQQIINNQVKTYRFTIPEGLRMDEVAPIMAAAGLGWSSQKLQELLNSASFANKLGVPAHTLEGFLFPDTYFFSRNTTEEAALKKMVDASLAAYAAAPKNPNNPLNLLEAMTLASIIEKETGAPEERPRISCVFHNRLRLNMLLQTDPTVLYAKMLRLGHFENSITREDLRSPHPYNTYTTKGLPPGPIASGGKAAIEAALMPLECKELYFVSRNDGTHVFCENLQCHEKAVDKWQRQFHKKKKSTR